MVIPIAIERQAGMETMSVSEFKKKALGAFKKIARSGGEIIITRYGKAIW